MSVLESSNLRDLLRVRDNEDDGREALAGLTLAAVLNCETTNPRRPSRTLLDIIKDEESGAAYRGLMPPHSGSQANNNSWKSFRNRLRLRRAGAAFSSSTSTHPVNACDFAIEDYNIRISPPVLVDRRGVTRSTTFNSARNSSSSRILPQNGVTVTEPTEDIITIANSINQAVREEEEQRPAREEMGLNSTGNQLEIRQAREMELDSAEHGLARESVLNSITIPVDQMPPRTENAVNNEINTVAVGTEEVVAPPRVSLMALLEETDWNAGAAGSIGMETDEVEEEEKKDKVEEGGLGSEGVEYVCCVCMVRHKGAAFIPCGHTFCRLCSRELWVNRGNCPLCNGYILEILDIF